MAKNKLSYSQRSSLISDALRAVFSGEGVYTWTEDVYDDYAIVNVERSGEPRELFKVEYTWDGDTPVLGEPQQVKREISYVSFSTDDQFGILFDAKVKLNPDGTFTVPALIFECGEYPDKGFSLTQEEADQWVGEAGWPILLDHKVSVFHKDDPFSIGKVSKTWRTGDQIYAEIVFEGWVKPGMAGKRIPLSVGFDAATKKPVEVSLTSSPRVKAAELLATVFNAPKTPGRTGSPMSNILTTIKGLWSGATPEEQAQIKQEFAATPPPPAVPVTTPVAAPDTAKDDEIKALRKEASKNRAEKLVEAFASKLTPAAKPHAVALFESALESSELVKFDDETVAAAPKVKQLVALFESLPTLPGLTPGQPVAEFAAAPDGQHGTSIFDAPTHLAKEVTS